MFNSWNKVTDEEETRRTLLRNNQTEDDVPPTVATSDAKISSLSTMASTTKNTVNRVQFPISTENTIDNSVDLNDNDSHSGNND